MYFIKVPKTESSSIQNGNVMQSSSATIMTGSNLSYDTEEMCEEKDDENLENLRRKVNLIIDIASNTSSNTSSTTVINKKYVPKSEKVENNNNVIDSEDDDSEFNREKKLFNYSARIKRYFLKKR